MYMKIYDRTILFTGDIEDGGERYILTKDIKDLTILKVAHHGSITSSSDEFINKMKPTVSLISVGLNNEYNHPDIKVIERLENINSYIYRSDYDGSVTITFLKNTLFIKTYKKSDIIPINRRNIIRFILN